MKRLAPQTQDLLPEGAIVRVTPWRRQIFWVGAAIMGFLAAYILIYALRSGRPVVALGMLGYGLFGLALARTAICGVIVESSGIRARSTFRTYQWRWAEIRRFELRERGETPRFRVHLQNGQVRGFLGFFARTPAEETRAKELFEAMQARLQAEQLKLAEVRPAR